MCRYTRLFRFFVTYAIDTCTVPKETTRTYQTFYVALMTLLCVMGTVCGFWFPLATELLISRLILCLFDFYSILVLLVSQQPQSVLFGLGWTAICVWVMCVVYWQSSRIHNVVWPFGVLSQPLVCSPCCCSCPLAFAFPCLRAPFCGRRVRVGVIMTRNSRRSSIHVVVLNIHGL